MAIITILQFPESESCNILVNFESLHGMCLPFEVRAFIQFPNANKLLFILPLSLFIFDVADTFSLPAKFQDKFTQNI